nr:unnamed protein product [Digitaria exilis]
MSELKSSAVRVQPGDGINEALTELFHVVRRQRDAHLHPAIASAALRHRQRAGPRHGHDVHLLRRAEPHTRNLGDPATVSMLIAPPTSVNRSIHPPMLSVPTPRTASSIAAATAAHALSNPPAPPPASTALGASASAGPTQLPTGGFIRERWSTGNSKQVFWPSPPGGDQRGAPWRRDAATHGLGGHDVLDVLHVVFGQGEGGEELVAGAGPLDGLRLVGGRHRRRLEEGVVKASRVGDEAPVRDRRWRFSAGARGSGPGVKELRGGRAINGGVVNGDADGEASAAAPGQERGLNGEHGGATRGQRWHERRDRGDLPGLIGGEAVEDAVVAGVLGDGEGDAVAEPVVELVAVGRAGGEPEAAGERVESVEDTRQGVLEVGDDGVDVGVRCEAVEEEALHGREGEPEDVVEGERQGGLRWRGA